ncbi:PAS domain S-box protein [Sorangium sp. So ce1128]
MTSSAPADTARHYRELLAINRLITSSLDLSVVLATVTRQAAALLRAEAAALLLREDGTLKVAAAYHLPGGARDLEVPLGPGVMACIRDLGCAPLAGCVGVPLVLRGETIGVLAAYRRDTAPATAEDEELLSALADQAAVALENARIYRQLQTQTEALQESEARFRLAFDEAPIGMALVGTDGRFLRVNNVLCEMVGYSCEELTSLTFRAITHPDDVDIDIALAESLARGEIPRYQLGKRYLRKDGAIVDILLSVSIVRDHNGAPLYYISQIEDVTRRKRIEGELRRSEAQYRGLIERLPDGVFIHRGGRIAYANRALTSLLGYDHPAAIVGRSLVDLYHPDDIPVVIERLRVLESGIAAPPRELRMMRRNGSICDVETTAIRVHFEDHQGFVVIVRDLAERRRAEREREEAYRRLRAIIDLAPVGIVLHTDGRHWDANVRAQQMFGRPIDPSIDISQYVGELLDATERPLAFEELPGVRALRGEQLEGVELRLRQPNGRLVPVLVNAARIPGGEAIPPTALIVFEDISALKDLERLRIEWSALIAHDLRQPLTGIVLYAQLVAQKTADPALQRKGQQIRGLAQRLGRLVQDLVDFTRLEARQLALDCQSADLAELIKEATERIALEAPDRPIELRVRGAPARVEVDADRIAQVMDNLLTNALKYGDPGTPIRIDVEAGADNVSVSVTNEGPGIAPEHMLYLFGRFQRARDTQRRGAKGLGLGLYITRELIEAHHGQIVAESVPGGTTTFRFTLLLAQPVAHVAEPDQRSS